MVVGVVVLGVVALGLLIGLVVVGRRASARARRVTELELANEHAQLEVKDAHDRSDAEAARAVEADGRAKAADRAAADANKRAEDAEARAEAAEEKVAEAIDRADQSEERALEADEARAAADEARVEAEAGRAEIEGALAAALDVRLFDADGMWALGRRRMARLWRDRLRLLPDEEPPLDGSDGDVEAAVRLLAEASREESGVVVDVTWSLTEPLSPARAALVVLLAEELVATARESDGAELEVAGDADGIAVSLRADPPTEPDTVAELRAAVETFGWMLDLAEGAVVVDIPTPPPDDEPDDDATGSAGDADAEGSTPPAGVTAF